MYKKLLVPLDGSSFAECAIEHVVSIAQGCNIPEVVLLRVVEPLPSTNLEALGQVGVSTIEKVEDWQKSEAADYITKMVQGLKREGVPVKGEIVTGKAADQILDYANNNHFDLIIMSTHGRSGVARWAFGSVADKVVRASTIPVLTVAPQGCRVSPT